MGISYTKGICREKRRLAGREEATTAYLDVGKSYEKRGSFNRLIAFIRGGEREGCHGPTHRQQDTDVEPDRRSHGARRVPLF
jgi:hypothetical protein